MRFFSELMALVLIAGGPDDFTMTLPVSPDTAEGQGLIEARAREICGARHPIRARYRFSGTERIDPGGERESRFEVRQELTCSDTPPAPSTEPPAPADWRPTARDEEDARGATQRYFEAVDRGDARRVHAMWSLGQQEEMPLERRAAELRRFRTEAGTPGAHRIARLTWYVNPQGALRPGIYVAADYERTYSGLQANCGYLVWFREAEGRYALIREETSIIAAGAGSDSPEAIEQARSVARCPAR